MPITFQQVGQISGITAFSSQSPQSEFVAVVFNPTMPALLFQYNSTYPAIVIGSQTQEFLWSQYSSQQFYSATITAYEVPTLWFANAVLTGGLIANNGICASVEYYWYAVYNQQNNSFNYSCNVAPANKNLSWLLDIAVDYVNQNVYLLHTATITLGAVIFAIPFNQLSTLINNLTFPSEWYVAALLPQGLPQAGGYILGNMVYYNETFYIAIIISQLGQPYQLYEWVISYSDITWNNSYPSAGSSVGTLYQVYNPGNTNNEIQFGISFLVYVNQQGNINPEIMLYFQYGGTLYIYQFDPNQLTPTNLFQLSNANASPFAINFGGNVTFIQSPSKGVYTVSMFNPSSLAYEQSNQITNVLGVGLAHGGYLVTLSGSQSSLTITIYQILVDTAIVIQNLQYSNGVLSGTVINLNGNTPLSGVTVYLYQLQTEGDNYITGQQVTTTTTDPNGNFSFQITQVGYYGILVF